MRFWIAKTCFYDEVNDYAKVIDYTIVCGESYANAMETFEKSNWISMDNIEEITLTAIGDECIEGVLPINKDIAKLIKKSQKEL